MHRRLTSRSIGLHGSLRFAALAVLGVLLAHDATFAADAAAGANDAQFAVLGHRYWASFTALAVLAAALLAATALTALARLSRAVSGCQVPTPATTGPSYRTELFRLWPRLLVVVTAAFVLQENVEHLATGLPLPGLWVLSAPGYPFAIPALLLVTGLLAALGAWFRRREAALLERLCAACAAIALRHPMAAPLRRPDMGWLSAYRLLLARPDAGRAPPAASST